MSIYQRIHHDDVLSTVQTAAIFSELTASNTKKPVMGEAAVPDVPVSAGVMIAGSYGLIMAGFFLGFAHGRDAVMMVVISALYATIYLTVPAIMLHAEGRGSRPNMQRFLRDGLNTWTGHASGRAALIQIMLIPLAIALAVFAIGIVAAVIA